MKSIDCKQCGGLMRRDHKVDKSYALQFVGLILFVIGLFLLVIVPIGTIIGIILMILAARMGYSRKKVWKCLECGYYFDRD